MTVSEGRRGEPAGLVLVAVGCQLALAEQVAQVAAELSALSAWPIRAVAADCPPTEALLALAQGRDTQVPPAWIAPVPVDPGLTLAGGGSWAEALGAFRQPTALVLAADQLASGWPAAATALLRQEKVPLVGLIQHGGAWEAERRCGDRLPWLGGLGEQRLEEGQELLFALAQRWRSLDLL